MIRMSALEKITAGRVSPGKRWEARLAICRAVHGRGSGCGPAFRLGSNAPLASIPADDLAAAEAEPCQFCGASGADILGGEAGGVGMEYCRTCGSEWVVGDYDWRVFADCLRYRADLAAGLVQLDVSA